MSNGLVTVNGRNLPVREHEGKRVVTLKDVAVVHKTKSDDIRRNFNRNKSHFINGIDYFHLKGQKARDKLSLPSNVTQLNVFTESGYLMLVKSLTDDLSWQVQRELVNSYFRGQGRGREIVDLFPLLQEEIKQAIYYRLEKGLTQKETAKILGISETTQQTLEGQLRTAGISLPRIAHNHAKFSLRNYKAMLMLEM